MAMTHLQRSKVVKWVSSNFVGAQKSSLSSVGSFFYIGENPRFYRTKRIVQTEILMDNARSIRKISDAERKEAQNAVLEYLQFTRNLQFADAENMSKNSPYFLHNLLAKIDVGTDIGHSISRFLLYHPINEFEPFFESLGLKPHEYGPFLPRDSMFLCDDGLLLENYYVLCNYGVARNKIGKIYKEAMEVFRYDYGVLARKLKAYEELELSQSFVIKLVVCSPYLFVGDVNLDFIKVLEIFRKGGVEFERIGERLSEKICYDWSQLLALLDLFRHAGYDEKQLGQLISQHPRILFEDSVDRISLLIGFLFKFGSTVNQICFMFLQFPQMQFDKFVLNLKHCFMFLNEIEMEVSEIGKLFRAHPLMLGSCRLKRASTLSNRLNARNEQICAFIQENPEVLKKWVLGSKIERLPSPREELRLRKLKIKFLLDVGFVENSDKLKKAHRMIHAKQTELQERFDCIVRAGLDRKDVCEMIKISPKILDQTKGVLKMKIDFLKNDLGYPLSALLTYPSYLMFSMRRIKIRFAMYNWLKDQVEGDFKLSLCALIACSDTVFTSRFVNRHPRGPEIWQCLRKKMCSK